MRQTKQQKARELLEATIIREGITGYDSRTMTPERHRRYVQRYITEATPFTRAMCELEMLMPSTYVQQADGSLQKTHDLWPQWAKDHWRTLNEICEEIQKRAARES